MKKGLFTLISLFVFSFGFSQLSDDNYDWLVHGKIKKEQLADAKVMTDIIPNYPTKYYANIMNYVSVEISGICNGKAVSSVSPNEVLTEEQKNILNSADFGTDLNVSIKFSYKDPAKDVYGGGGRIKEIKPLAIMVVPEKEAEYPGGNYLFLKYIKDKMIKENLDSISIQKINLAMMNFTVTEEGKIIGAKLLRSSTDLKLDNLILEALNKMPNWNPAENSQGIKVKQEFCFPVKRTGC